MKHGSNTRQLFDISKYCKPTNKNINSVNLNLQHLPIVLYFFTAILDYILSPSALFFCDNSFNFKNTKTHKLQS